MKKDSALMGAIFVLSNKLCECKICQGILFASLSFAIFVDSRKRKNTGA